MAANDYHVIVYQILAYLYSCLKDGVDVDLASIEQFKEKTYGMFGDFDWKEFLQKEFKIDMSDI